MQHTRKMLASECHAETNNESWLADESPPASLFNELQHNNNISYEEVTTNTSELYAAAFPHIPDYGLSPQDTQKTTVTAIQGELTHQKTSV